MRGNVLGIDPGPVESAFALVSPGQEVLRAGKEPNEKLLADLKADPPAHVSVESIQSYGAPVGRSTFETCYTIGRILQVCADLGIPCDLYPRPEYTRRICGVGKISDAVLRQALLLRFGGDKKGEPLHALKGNSDKRSAFAVAVFHIDAMDSRVGARPSSCPLPGTGAGRSSPSGLILPQEGRSCPEKG